MPSEPRWLPFDEVVELNRQLVAATGEPHGILKAADLDAACHAPRWLWEYGEQRDLLALAVRLLFGIARSHGFVQGNKRTAFVAAVLFLEQNGWSLDDELDGDLFGALIVEVLTGQTSEEEFVRRLRPHIIPAEV
ncbi:MAG TPA: type II toxin-antitoxin system death-on-curing family toxin [Caulobacteraceae bacterium]|nr:type II toxin-antitoxin system death-on-curing family toxin [Caulobacteraceae bacterium]